MNKLLQNENKFPNHSNWLKAVKRISVIKMIMNFLTQIDKVKTVKAIDFIKMTIDFQLSQIR